MLKHCGYHILILILGVLGLTSSPLHARAQNGTLDLRDWDFSSRPQVLLKGDWEFHWAALYTQEDLQKQTSKPEWIPVPGLWNFVKDYPKRGYATYRLRVLLNDVRPLAIRMPWVLSASRLYIDDRLIEEAGQVAKDDDPAVYRPVLYDDYWNFTPSAPEFDIIVQVASFNIHLPGMPNTPTLGTPEAIKRSFQIEVGLTLFLVGCLFVMAIYHFCLFALRTLARSTLYFACLCFFIALYMTAASSATLGAFFPQLNYAQSMRFFMVWMVAVPFFAYYSHTMYPRLFSRKLAHFLMIAGPGIYLGSFFSEVKDTEIPFIAFNLVTGIYAIHVLIQAIKAWRMKEDGSGIFLSATIVLFISAIHDSIRLFFESIALGGFGLFAFIIGQSILLARRFSQAFDRVDKLSAELRVERDQVVALNENLEDIVADKTREIRSIMEQIPLGIFLITRERRKVHKDYSQHLLHLFEESELTGWDGFQLLFARSELNTDEKSQIDSVLSVILGESDVAFQLNQAALPREVVVNRKNGQRMILDLGWSPIMDHQGDVDQLLVTVRDVTELRSLELEARDKQEELQFIQELINVPASTFHRFTSNCRDFLNENRRLINTGHVQQKDMEVLKILFINMHTMKGAARSLYFKKMTRIFHDVEQYYALLQKESNASWDIVKMNRDLDEAERIIDIYDGINSEKLGRRPSEDKGGSISHRQARQLFEALDKARRLMRGAGPRDAQVLLDGAAAELFAQLYRPLRSVLLDISRSTETLARDLGKEAPEVRVDCEGLHVTARTEELLFKIFVHILRNTMDHGLETAAERLKAGKDPQGQIHMQVQRQGSFVCIFHEDDGRGLDLEKIRNTARKNRLILEDSRPGPAETAELIFLTGFSTAGEASDISGRGVGMDAIRNFARQAGGDARIHLHESEGKGSRFHPFTLEILLPASLFVSSSQDLEAA
jgi:PAS domain-containing protein